MQPVEDATRREDAAPRVVAEADALLTADGLNVTPDTGSALEDHLTAAAFALGELMQRRAGGDYGPDP